MIYKKDIIKYVIFVLFVVKLSQSNQTLQHTCGRTNKQQICKSKFVRVLKGSFQSFRFQQSICTNASKSQICNPFLTRKNNFTLFSCSHNYNNDPCVPGVCYTYPKVQLCSLDDSCLKLKNKSALLNYQCRKCQKNTSCQKCLFISTQNSTNWTQKSCFGKQCPIWLQKKVQINYTTCPVYNKTTFDYLGQSCQCCYKSVSQVPFCLTDNRYLNSKNLAIWFFRAEALFGEILVVIPVFLCFLANYI